MDWRSVNFDWNRARAFLITAQEGSLSAAARALGMSQPTLSRQVSALEKELGVVLFERVGLGLTITPSGLELLQKVKLMGEAASQFSLLATGQSQQLEGNVCISASEVYAMFWLPKIVAKLRLLEPKIHIEIIATSQVSDLRMREADIAIRNFRPTQPELIARKIKEVEAKLYATTEYLNSIAKIDCKADLAGAAFISFDGSGMLLKGLQERGLNLTAANFPVLSESFMVHWEMVKQGLGIGIMPEDIGALEPKVRQVLPSFSSISFPIWLTVHRELQTSSRVRMVYDLLATELAKPYSKL
ncbi:MAG: LysR family transcriptional regulator [Oceanospirillaceae bacterium]|nr:LysR family transcriptional regulator [Oceanospirillaceae bacterium]